MTTTPPPEGLPPQGFPPQGFPPQAFPPQGFPAQGFPPQGQGPWPAEPEQDRRSDPLSVALIALIVAALVLAALLGGELYARHRANTIVASAVGCVVRDSASASFGLRPFLIQHFTHRYRDMVVETAGNQIREAKGMKMRLRLDDIQLNQTSESAGTLGSLDADVTWSADGIKQTVQGMIPMLGGLISAVTTKPSSDTIELQGPLGSVTIQPEVANGALALTVTRVTGLGFTLPRESVQPALDAITKSLSANLPMGIHAENIEVTDSGVTAKYVTRDATIPNGQQDPCFAGV